MFNKLKEFFQNEVTTLDVDKGGNPTAHDLQVATTVLLIEMAGADDEIAQEEAEALCNTMANQFGLDKDDIPELVEIAIAARQESNKIDDFVAKINENFNESQKIEILKMIWKVVLADGKIDKFEERFAVQLQTRFKLPADALEQARAAVTAES